MQRIILIEPQPPGYHVYSSFPLPRLGLFILGALMKNRGYDVSVYLQQAERIPKKAVQGADIVGISSTTSTTNEAFRLARFASEAGKPVIMGGPHVTFLPDEALQFCDVVVRGEGEESFPEVVYALLSGGPLGGIQGISYKDGGTVLHTPARPLIKNLDTLPFPDFSLANKMSRSSTVPVLTSRGCPFGCTFCSVTEMFGRGYRFRSEENIAEELALYPKKKVFFCDDNFTANQARTMRLLNIMTERGLARRGWSAQTRVEITRNPELLDAMHAAGCRRVYIGFESINPRTLARFNKSQSPEDVAEAVRVLHRHRIRVHGMFVLGSDDDEVETLRETAAFANRMKIDSVQFLALTPLPGTQATRELEEQGRVLTHNWSLYDGHHVVFAPKRMTPYQLHAGALRAMLQFYNWRQALRFGVRFDVINAALRIIGSRITRKGARGSRDFAGGLRRYEYQLAQRASSDSFAFDENSRRSRILRFKEKHAARIGKKLEALRAKLTIVDEMKTRASFITLRGDIDVPQARALYRSAKRCIRRGKREIVLDFEHVEDISERAEKYIPVKLARLEKRRAEIKILGLPGRIRARLESACQHIPLFEFYESLDSFRRGVKV